MLRTGARCNHVFSGFSQRGTVVLGGGVGDNTLEVLGSLIGLRDCRVYLRQLRAGVDVLDGADLLLQSAVLLRDGLQAALKGFHALTVALTTRLAFIATSCADLFSGFISFRFI